MAKKRNLLIGIVGIAFGLFALYMGLPDVTEGILYRLNPPEYVPKGYVLTKNYQKQQTEDGEIFISKLEKGDKEIQITQMNKFDWSCNGPTKTVVNAEICYFQREGASPEYDQIFYDKFESTIQIFTNDISLSDDDLVTIIANF